MISPYFCYALSFSVALLVYLLGWSTLYPKLTWPLILFLVITIILHLLAGVRLTKKTPVFFIPLRAQSIATHVLTTAFLYLLWLCEFLYEGGIPFFKILLNQPYNYKLFGIPTLHVFIVTFSSFYTVYLFHVFLSSRKRILLVLFLINLFAAVLIYSRAMFFFNLTACFFLWVLFIRKIPRSVFYILPVMLLLLFYLFGVLGTLRVSRETQVPYDNGLFLSTGQADSTFINSAVPKEYFWAYIYISSPLANLQNNINSDTWRPITARRFAEMFNNEVLMDFISKRINRLLGTERARDNTIPGPFNVSTVYSRSFSYWEWGGMIFMALIVIAIPWIYKKLLPTESPFFLSGYCILCTMFLFLAYDNTIRFTGLSFQLVYPFVLEFARRKFLLLQKVL